MSMRRLALTLALVPACSEHAPAFDGITDWEVTEATTTDASTSAASDTTSTAASTSDGTDTDADASVGETLPGESSTSTGQANESSDSTSASTGDTTSTDTTGSAAFCGNGMIDQDSEECDDSSPSADGPCSPLCQRERVIFVLSLKLNGKLSGLQGADAYCRSQASKAQKADPTSPIKDAKNFKALLPSSTQTIFDRHFRGKGRYRLINGLTVSDSFDRLFSEPLQNAINVDEFGQTHNTSVLTGSTADGQPYPGIDFCHDWTSVKGSASWGVSDHTDAEWIEVPDEIVQQPTEDCAVNMALYCVEQQ